NSLRDGYDETGFLSVSQWYTYRASVRGSEHAAIRDRFAFLWQHAIMGRSEVLRERESYRTSTLQRFYVKSEPIPDFSARNSWHRIKLLVDDDATDNNVGVTWAVQAGLLRQAFDKCSISSSHLTHAMRSGRAQFASAAGCTEDAIRKHGRWCGDRLMERYLTSVTLQPIRSLSGFNVVGGDYWLPRAVVDPPTTLSEQIFSWIEAKHEQVKTRAQAGGEADGAALQFLDMLKYLRVVLLQDSILLQAKFPSFPLWNHPPINTVEFATYAQNLTQAISTTTPPFEISITHLFLPSEPR
ncbi:hypothetical protein CF319_g5421, partial [Tilletia indica]